MKQQQQAQAERFAQCEPKMTENTYHPEARAAVFSTKLKSGETAANQEEEVEKTAPLEAPAPHAEVDWDVVSEGGMTVEATRD